MPFKARTNYQLEGMFFLSFIDLNYYIWSVAVYFSISFVCKVSENGISIYFCYWFWLVFVPFFTIQYSIAFTYFPINIIYLTLLKVFQTSVSWWRFPGVWVTASILKSPGLFSVFWSVSTILLFRLSPLVFLFPSFPVLVLILWCLYRVHQLRLYHPHFHVL